MHNSKVGFESSTVCTKATWKLVNICISKISKGEMLDLKKIKVLSIDQHPTAKVARELMSKPMATHPDEFSR